MAPLKVDQAALTGESLPVGVHVGGAAYAGSVVTQGEAEGVVIATGSSTFIGKAATLVVGLMVYGLWFTV